ncbi:MAG TPA: hypothetical protein VE973_00290, partial [Candidatus Limnocylindria bacterium]|nr:hypothetical protein [Candidatus Limnocylindria bacterium]
ITPRVYVESVLLLGLIILLSNNSLSLLRHHILQYIGKISYSMYLTHFIALSVLSKIPAYQRILNQFSGYGQFLFVFCTATLAAVLLSTITYALVEKPGQSLGKYLSARLS